MWQHLRKREFADDARLLALTQELERQWNGNMRTLFALASFRLRTRSSMRLPRANGTCFVSERFGACVVLLIWLLWDSLFDDSQGIDLFQHPIVHVYAAIGGGLLLLWA